MRSLRTALPVGSSLPCYAWRGRPSSTILDAAASRSSFQIFAREGRRASLWPISRDLLVLSFLLATPPLHAHSTDAPINLTLTFTATTVIAIALALVIGTIAGLLLGAFSYAALLQDADHSATSYRARALARIFETSTVLHATVDQLVRDAHERITALQSTLADLRAKEHRHAH